MRAASVGDGTAEVAATKSKGRLRKTRGRERAVRDTRSGCGKEAGEYCNRQLKFASARSKHHCGRGDGAMHCEQRINMDHRQQPATAGAGRAKSRPHVFASAFEFASASFGAHVSKAIKPSRERKDRERERASGKRPMIGCVSVSVGGKQATSGKGAPMRSHKSRELNSWQIN